MPTAAILTPASPIASSATPARQAPAKVADKSFNQVLAHQIQGHKNGNETENTTANKTDSTSETDVVIQKADENESLSDGKDAIEAASPGIDTVPTTPVELLALVASINQVTNKSTNTSPPLDDSLQLLSDDDLSKEPLEILDGKQDKLGHGLQVGNASGKTSRIGDAAATSADRQVGLQTEFGATAQKIHEMAIPTSTPVIAQMSQVPLNLLQASTTQLTEKLMPQVGTQGWDQALGQKIVWMVAGSQQSATLTLNPPDLGPLQIILNVSNNQADATFISTQPEVRHALEAAMPRLREMMNEAGIQLSDATVSSNTPNHHGASQQNSRKAFNNFNENNDASVAVSQLAQTRPLIAGKQMVDTFA